MECAARGRRVDATADLNAFQSPNVDFHAPQHAVDVVQLAIIENEDRGSICHLASIDLTTRELKGGGQSIRELLRKWECPYRRLGTRLRASRAEALPKSNLEPPTSDRA